MCAGRSVSKTRARVSLGLGYNPNPLAPTCDRIILFLPLPICIAHTIPILLHDEYAIYDPPPPSFRMPCNIQDWYWQYPVKAKPEPPSNLLPCPPLRYYMATLAAQTCSAPLCLTRRTSPHCLPTGILSRVPTPIHWTLTQVFYGVAYIYVYIYVCIYIDR